MQVRSESAQIQGKGAQTHLSMERVAIAFVTMSNLDAWGLWVTEGKEGKDPPKAVCALTNEYNGSVVMQVTKPASTSCFLEYPILEPSYCAVRKSKQPMKRSTWRGT